YRCHNCFSEPIFCSECCRTQHVQLPFHKISRWDGDFFGESSLTRLGMEYHLGHRGLPCP
ncbi:hypothetical protein C8R48DRAFT_540338, partial [Suillus tomentosus]